MPREMIERIERHVKENVERVAKDVGHAVGGHPEHMSPETKTQLKEMAVKALVDSGATEISIPVSDSSSIGARRDRDGTIRVGFRVEF